MVTIKTFDDPIIANVVNAKLNSEGIRSYLYDEQLISIDPLSSLAIGGIKLRVEEDDVEKANSILQEMDELPIVDENDEVILCPTCSSSDITSGYKTARGIKGFFATIIALLFFVLPPQVTTTNKCKSCGTEFDIEFE